MAKKSWAPSGLGTPDASECDLSVTTPATDYRACTNKANSFDFTYDVTKEPLSGKTQVSASITNLFYMNNFLHDWFYDAGFDEAAGNAQLDNYGRGGIGNDPIIAEAMDYGGTNNANMSTPADGGRPRMQMYLWPRAKAHLQITAPAAAAGKYALGSAAYGPQDMNLSGKIGAALNRLPTAAELGLAVKWMEKGGKSADDVLAGVVAGAEFMEMSNAMSNTQFVANLYNKVMGKPTDRMAAFYANGLRTGYYSRADLVKMSAGSDENMAAVKAMIPNGVEYTPAP